ncbi:Pre-mRNA-splicing factor SLT11 [Spathaspora sp. JA1]|nr:Pre-mRNA-splicing factor SLT11 [Spathaspora sp. JA1]
MSEEESFSICTSCLGNDKHVRMIKQDNGAECKQCTRPFTVYRWGNRSASNKLNKTLICLTCARAKNCCQSCMLDINYGIPTELRDTALKLAGLEPMSLLKSSTNREVKAIMADKLQESFSKQDKDGSNENKARELLMKLAEKLNAKEKPREIEGPTDSKVVDSANVSKLSKKLPFGNSLESEKHPEITSFFIFGFPKDLPQYLVTKYCGEYGKVKGIVFNHDSRCGFISFEKRESAEAFARSIDDNGLNKNKKTAGLLVLEGNPMRVCWGKQKPLAKTSQENKQISLVVAKVMKQLAEKDRNAENIKTTSSPISTSKKSKVPQASSDKSSSKRVKPQQVKYKALKEDFEI